MVVQKASDKELKQRLLNLLADIARMDVNDIDENASIRDDLGLDSVSSVEILAAVETRLDINIDEAKAMDVVSVKDLINLVFATLKEKT
ncbi:MAG: acyl carrier protein [Candidatus Omnitrophota bacterium]